MSLCYLFTPRTSLKRVILTLFSFPPYILYSYRLFLSSSYFCLTQDLNDSFSGNTTALGLGEPIHGPSTGYSPAVQTKTTSTFRVAPFQSDTLSPISRHDDSKDIDPRLGSASPILLSSSLHASPVHIDHRSLLLDSDSRVNVSVDLNVSNAHENSSNEIQDVDTLRREFNKLLHNLSLANENASTEREKVFGNSPQYSLTYCN